MTVLEPGCEGRGQGVKPVPENPPTEVISKESASRQRRGTRKKEKKGVEKTMK